MTTVYPRMLEGKFRISAGTSVTSKDPKDVIKLKKVKTGYEVQYEFKGAERTLQVS